MKRVLSAIIISLFCVSELYATDLVMMTYNVRNDNNTIDAAKGDGWKQRHVYMCEQILSYKTDILGAQEVYFHQLKDILSKLKGYGYVGVGREDGKRGGEFAPIFYNKQKIALIKSGHFWMSPTSSVPSAGWDARAHRICTWAQFRDKSSAHIFFVFNLHMDHRGEIARVESSKLVVEKIKELSDGKPVVLCGDFNYDRGHQGYKYIVESGVLEDSFPKWKEPANRRSTTNGFNPKRQGGGG